MNTNALTHALREEHKTILEIISQIEKHLKNADYKVLQSCSIPQLKEILDRHLEKEDEVLFPMLQRYLGMDKGVVKAMQTEHREIEACFSAISESKSCTSGDSKLALDTKHMIRLLKPHLSKEDNVLFWLAEIKVPEYHYETLTKQMDKIDVKHLPKAKFRR
ncbi:MAG: hemerythrin domain-containing protein [Thaumarchaeota archaeon]|nr:hemerythrin domain-containing protein [Nitrososphaerota archaeon]